MSIVRDWEYIPREAFLYLPREEDMKEGSGKTMLRRIFESGAPYEEYQQQKLNELNHILTKKGTTMISWFTEANKLRFLHAKKFDIDETRKTILEHSKWRSTTIPIAETPELQAFLNCGAVYFSGRDHCFRPVLVIDVSKFDLNNPDTQKVDFLSRVLGIIFEFMIDNLFVEGQVENYVMVVNLNQLGVWSVGSLIKNIMSFTTNTYRSRLFAAYIVNSPGMITMFWNGIKGMLSENTVKKINFHGKAVPTPLFNHCGRDVIEEKFGGSRKDMTTGFWPPTEMNKRLFRLQPEHSSKLVNAQEYHKMYVDGKLKGRKVCKLVIEEAQHREPAHIPHLAMSHRKEELHPDRGSFGAVLPTSEDARTANFHDEKGSELKKGFSFMDQLSHGPILGVSRTVHNAHGEEVNPSVLTVGSAIHLPLKSVDIPDDPPHRIAVQSHTTRITQCLIRDLDLPNDHELHINQVRIIRTFFESSHYKNMKKNYYDFI